MKMKLAPGLELPPEAVTQTFALLAVRGAGKSNAAVVMAEEFHKAGLHWVAIDPKGDWWGVRSSGDGRGPGLKVIIFGGRHQDLPLEPGAGEMLAKTIVEQRITCVLDVSEFTNADTYRFLAAFFEAFYRAKNETQDPTHLFMDECDVYLPQKPMREQNYVLHHAQRMIKMGRSRGIGGSLISQRSAVVNKDCLTQTENMIVLRTTAPQDRAAVEGWIEYHKQKEDVLESLPSLDNGEAWVYSPQFLKVTKKVRFRRRETFDSGATPSLNKTKRAPAKFAEVDLEQLRQQMAATIEKAKAEDPRELQVRIRGLERELAAAKVHKCPAAAPAKAEIVEVPVLPEKLVKQLEAAMGRTSVTIAPVLEKMQEVLVAIRRAGGQHASLPKRPVHAGNGHAAVVPAVVTERGLAAPPGAARATYVSREVQVGPLGGGLMRILNNLRWLETGMIQPAKRAMVAFLGGSTPTSSHFQNMVSTLKTGGFLTYPTDGYLELTSQGREITQMPAGAITSEVLQGRILQELGGLQRKILQLLIESYPSATTREYIATEVGSTPSSSHFQNVVSSMKTTGLLDYPGQGQLRAADALFLR